MSRAIDDLVVREIPYLRRFARVLAQSDVADADDLVQDCLEQAIARQVSLRPNGGLRGWLFAILHHAFVDSVRSRMRNRFRIVDDSFLERVATAPVHEAAATLTGLARGVALLPEGQRATVSLIAIEGCSYEEAAEIMKVPVATVRSRLSQARASLRRFMDQHHANANLRDESDGGTAAQRR